MLRALVIGLGNFGYAFVTELVSKNCEVVVIEKEQARAQIIKDLVEHVIVADAANKDILSEYAKDIDCAVVCLGERVDSSLLAVHSLKDIGVKRIIAKATTIEHAEILKIVGANEVVLPEIDAAKRLATNLISPDIVDFIKVSKDFDIVEIALPDKFANQTIAGLQLRSKYGIEILAVRNVLTDETIIMPPANYQFKPDDVMVVIGAVDSLKKIPISAKSK